VSHDEFGVGCIERERARHDDLLREFARLLEYVIDARPMHREQKKLRLLRCFERRARARVRTGIPCKLIEILANMRVAEHDFMSRMREDRPELSAHEARPKDANAHFVPLFPRHIRDSQPVRRAQAILNGMLTIRPAAPADIPAIGRLGALMVRTHHDYDPLRFIAATPQTEQGYGDFLRTQLDKPNVVVLSAEQDGNVVGYTYAGIEPADYMSLRGPAGAVYDIVVDPAHRRAGIGAKLLDATLTELERRGAPRVLLSTAEQNEPAQRLFASAGFRRTMIEMTREL
jgi:ribosomal protein S18 acetylase RimI-like enzyme